VELTFQAFLAGLVPGMLMWAMIIVNEIPDYEEDKKTGKKNLVVRLGREKGVILFRGGLIAIYLYIVGLIVLGVFPVFTIISLLSIPFAWRSVNALKKHYLDKIEIGKANKEMVKVYSTTTILLALGFLL
jgi:1,4-dihydroxy-2-naphthoate octaprenyltransferase